MQIFSHMSDSYLLQTSVPKISTIGLLECLYITTLFDMKVLGGKYSEALVQRLDNNNFIQVRSILLFRRRNLVCTVIHCYAVHSLCLHSIVNFNILIFTILLLGVDISSQRGPVLPT